MEEILKETIESNFSFRLNKNQFQDIQRLIFEITRSQEISLQEVISYLKNNASLNKYTGKDKFFALKNTLIERRFPLTSKKKKIDTKKVFLTPLKKPLEGSLRQKEFKPLKIFVEKEVKKSYLADNFKSRFTEAKIEEISYYGKYLEKNKFNISQIKEPIVFIVKEKWDFIKPCPCAKYHVSCGYWIFNLGFGCPFDCSYCFLQSYANFPGIILPANLEDFFEKFNLFAKELKKPIRIGTGEFCDSLALDDVTEYSKKLIPYFEHKNVLFELKTKSNNVANLLSIKPSRNAIISWSLNPPLIVEKEEWGTASLEERFEAAKIVQKKGYGIGFHFDPIIHLPGWENQYKEVIDGLYDQLKPPFSWISLGTLRFSPELKTIGEARFPQSNIFYGELFLGGDKKLRYPEFLRRKIYKNMLKWIRKYDTKTQVYLCMENKTLWKVGGNFSSSEKVENYLWQW